MYTWEDCDDVHAEKGREYSLDRVWWSWGERKPIVHTEEIEWSAAAERESPVDAYKSAIGNAFRGYSWSWPWRVNTDIAETVSSEQCDRSWYSPCAWIRGNCRAPKWSFTPNCIGLNSWITVWSIDPLQTIDRRLLDWTDAENRTGRELRWSEA